MKTCFAGADHFVTERLIGHYAKRAKGGVGLIVVGATFIHNPLGIALRHQLCIDGHKYISFVEGDGMRTCEPGFDMVDTACDGSARKSRIWDDLARLIKPDSRARAPSVRFRKHHTRK
jgi:hypothetical protein